MAWKGLSPWKGFAGYDLLDALLKIQKSRLHLNTLPLANAALIWKSSA
jgi:hypothetical protein